MMNKSLRGHDAESSGKLRYGFRAFLQGMQPEWEAKKEPPETGGFES